MLNPKKFNQYMSYMSQELYRYKFSNFKFPNAKMEKEIVQSSTLKVEEILEPFELNLNFQYKLTPQPNKIGFEALKISKSIDF